MKRYTDFLKNKKFIQWQLLPDDTLNEYWQDYINQYPESKRDIKKAINYLKTEGLNKIQFEEGERLLLLDKIQTTIRNRQYVQRRRLVWYSVASIALLVIGFTLFYTQWRNKSIATGKEFIVGELMNSEEIQLLTSDESISFQNDIDIKLTKNGKAEITQSNKKVQEIEIKQDKLNTLIIPYGKCSTLILADGSKVWLNSGSVLEFPAEFSGKSRGIFLASGEMYIEVVPDKKRPFYVQTSNLNVKVYGTKFNISNYYGSSQSVVLVEGRVSLKVDGHEELFIAPSEQVTYYETGAFDIQIVNTDRYISWKDGYLTLDKTPISEVLQQIGRYYNLSFDYEQDVNLKKRTCTGKIYLSDHLDNILETIGILSSTIYKRADNQIYFSNKSL